jgi:hypothetical protein
MSEKNLTEAAWKSFSKGKGYKDDALLKALAAVAKAEKGSADDRLSALETVVGESAKLGKLNPKDKELASYIAEIGKAASREKIGAQRSRPRTRRRRPRKRRRPSKQPRPMVPTARRC